MPTVTMAQQQYQSRSVKSLWELCCTAVRKNIVLSVDQLCELPAPLVSELAVGLRWPDLIKLEDTLKNKDVTERAWQDQYELIPRYKNKGKEKCFHGRQDPSVPMSFRDKWFSCCMSDYLAERVVGSMKFHSCWEEGSSYCGADETTAILKVAKQAKKLVVRATTLAQLQPDSQLFKALATNLVELRVDSMLYSETWLKGLQGLMVKGQSRLRSLHLDKLQNCFSDCLLLLFIASGMSQCSLCAQRLSAVRDRVRDLAFISGKRVEHLSADGSSKFPSDMCCDTEPSPVWAKVGKSHKEVMGKSQSVATVTASGSSDWDTEGKDLMLEKNDDELTVPMKGGVLKSGDESLYDSDLTVSPGGGGPESGEGCADLWDECLAPLEQSQREKLAGASLVPDLSVSQTNLDDHTRQNESGEAVSALGHADGQEEEGLDAAEKLYRMIAPSSSMSSPDCVSLYNALGRFSDRWMHSRQTGDDGVGEDCSDDVSQQRDFCLGSSRATRRYSRFKPASDHTDECRYRRHCPHPGHTDECKFLRILRGLCRMHREEGHVCWGVEHFSLTWSNWTSTVSNTDLCQPMYRALGDIGPCWPSLVSLGMDAGLGQDGEEGVALEEYQRFLDTLQTGVREGKLQAVVLNCDENTHHQKGMLRFLLDTLRTLSGSDPPASCNAESMQPMRLVKLELRHNHPRPVVPDNQDESVATGHVLGDATDRCRPGFRGLQELVLEQMKFEGVGAFLPVAEFIRRDFALQHLSLRGCVLNSASVDLLFRALSSNGHRSLSCVDLTQSLRGVTDAQWRVVCGLLDSPSMTLLTMADCGLQARHVKHAGFMRAVKSHGTLRSLTLDLSSNSLGNSVWDFLAEVVSPDSSLKELHMMYTGGSEVRGLSTVEGIIQRHSAHLPLLRYSTWNFSTHKFCCESDLAAKLRQISEEVFYVFGSLSEFLAVM